MEPLIILYIVLAVLAGIVLLLCLLKVYVKLTCAWDRSATCLVGKTVIVTGANAGIGYETALDFAKRGARVILACRDSTRGEEAKSRIVEATGNENVVLRLVDLGSLSSVRKFAEETKNVEERLDVLVNNAGAVGLTYSMSDDGLPRLMQVNHYGPFLLTVLLVDLLKTSAPSRVVMVSSALARSPRIRRINGEEDFNAPPRGPFAGAAEYANTKICNVLFANELARRLKDTGVTVNSLGPGAVHTDILHNASSWIRVLAKPVMMLLYKTPLEGAQTPIYVSVSKEIEGVTGQFFDECSLSSMPRRGNDKQLAKKLWDVSEAAVKLTEEESQKITS